MDNIFKEIMRETTCIYMMYRPSKKIGRKNIWSVVLDTFNHTINNVCHIVYK